MQPDPDSNGYICAKASNAPAESVGLSRSDELLGGTLPPEFLQVPALPPSAGNDISFSRVAGADRHLESLPMEEVPAPTRTSRSSWSELSVARPLTIALLMVTAAVIVFAHRVDAFTYPQFYAEDGTRWFTAAYNLGPLQALDAASAGSLQVVSRLGAVLAAPFGLTNQPLVYNLCGLLVQLAPVFYFLSSRFETVVPKFWLRMVLSLVYLLMPDNELNVTITLAPVHLIILATLVVLASQPNRWYWKVFDASTVLLCGLSGPFVFILFPITALWYLVRRRRFTLVLLGVLAVTLAVQLYVSRVSPRADVNPGGGLGNLLLILSDRIILPGIFGEPGHRNVYLAEQTHETVYAGLICLAALAVVAYSATRAPWELRLFGLTSAGIAVAGLLSPLVSFTGNQWLIMATSDAAGRYFFMARLAWLVTLIWALSRLPSAWMRRTAWVAGGLAFASGFATWGYTPFANYDWPREARAIQTAAPGTKLTLPINPGGPWAVEITVK